MNEVYDRREYDRVGNESDRYKVYVCWSLDEEWEFFISRSCFYNHLTVYFRPRLFEDAANSTRHGACYFYCYDLQQFITYIHHTQLVNVYIYIIKYLTYSTAMYYSMRLLLKHLHNKKHMLSLTMTEVVTWPDHNNYSYIASTMVFFARQFDRKL